MSRWGADPAAVAESKDLIARLHESIERMDQGKRSVAEELAAGATRRQCAAKFGLTEAQAKYLRQEVIAELKARLGVDSHEMN
jgi:FixJ family two-component response regulator